MNLLALETATECCSVALLTDQGVLKDTASEPRRHSQLLLPMIDALFAEAALSVGQLDAIAFGRGPGAFTGVRIAASATQAIAMAHDLPVVPVSSLLALAQQTSAEAVHAAIDARLGEVYWASCKRNGAGLMELVGEERVAAPEAVPKVDLEQAIGAGSGWAHYGETLRARFPELDRVEPDQYPDAEAIARLAVPAFTAGRVVTPEEAVPVYLRDRVASKPDDRKSTR